jgi:hypothetical protein
VSQGAAPEQQGAGSTEGESVLHLLSQLGDQLDAAASAERSGGGQEWPPTSMQREEDEALLVGYRQGLARLADSSRREPGEGEPAVSAVLDGAQLIARNKLLAGRGEDLRRLLPAFAYLVLLPILGEEEADRVAERAGRLVAGAAPARLAEAGGRPPQL